MDTKTSPPPFNCRHIRVKKERERVENKKKTSSHGARSFLVGHTLGAIVDQLPNVSLLDRIAPKRKRSTARCSGGGSRSSPLSPMKRKEPQSGSLDRAVKKKSRVDSSSECVESTMILIIILSLPYAPPFFGIHFFHLFFRLSP